MKIKTKIFLALAGMSVLVGLVGAVAVDRQHAAAVIAVRKEASDVARVVSFLMTDNGNSSAAAQEIAIKLHQAQGRDVVLVNSHQLVLADAEPASVGKLFTEDQHNEVAATLRDGKERTFAEISADHPTGIKQLVVPINSPTGEVIGAVILEYTPLYKEMLDLTKTTGRTVVLATLGSLLFGFMIAFTWAARLAGRCNSWHALRPLLLLERQTCLCRSLEKMRLATWRKPSPTWFACASARKPICGNCTANSSSG